MSLPSFPSQREHYLSTLVQIQQELLALPPHEDPFQPVLQKVGQVTGASRVYVFENHQDANGRWFTSQRAEWCNLGIPAELDNPQLQNVAYEDWIPRWWQVLSSGEMIEGVIADFPEVERQILEPQGIQAIVILPLMVRGSFWGFIGFDNCLEAQAWDITEIDLLRAITSALALVLERRQVEAALQEREHRLRVLFEQASVGITITAMDGQFLEVNQAYADMLGYSPAELQQMSYQDLDNPDPQEQQRDQHLNRQIRQGEADAFRTERRYLTKHGQLIWIDLTVTVVKNAQGQAEFTFAIVQDITERKRAEQELQLLQQTTEAIAECSDFTSALSVVLRQVCQATDWDFGEAWIPNAGYNRLNLSPAWYGSSESMKVFRMLSRDLTFGVGEGLPGQIWAARRPLWIADVSSQPEATFSRARIARRVNLKACFGVPILANHQVLAVLVFFLESARVQDQRLVELVSTVADQLGSQMQRKQVEEELRQSEERFRCLMEQAADGMILHDFSGRIIDVNPRTCDMLGYASGELLQRRVEDLEISDAASDAPQTWKTLQPGIPMTWRTLYRRKDNSTFPVEARVGLLEVGNQHLILSLIRDVSERQRAEQALQAAEMKFRSIFENSLEGIFQSTPTGSYLSANPALAQIYGYDTPEQMIASLTNIAQNLYVDPHRRQEFIRVLGGQGTITHFESQVYRKDGSKIWISESARVVKNPDGSIAYYEGFVEDITRRKAIEQALRENEEQFRGLFENTLIGIYRTTPDGQTILANPAIIQMMACRDFQELADWNLEQDPHYPHYYSRQQFKEDLERNGEIRGLEIDYRRRDGKIITVRENARVVRNQEGQILYYEGTFEDITERKKAERELEKSLLLLQGTLESTADGILAVDRGGQIFSYNRKFVEMWGIPDPLMDPDGYRQERLQFMADQTLDPAGFIARINQLFQLQEEAFDVVELKDGRVFERYSTSQQLGDKGYGRVWSYRDITERQRIVRMKNEFVSTVSHELRTPLTSIRGSLGLIAGGVGGELPPQVKHLIDIAYKNSERLVVLINDILDIEKIESGKMHFDLKPLSLVPLLEQSVESNRAYGQQFGVNYRLETNGTWRVNADANRLMQVMANLLSNAAKFSPPHSEVVVRVEAHREQVRVSVVDRGSGIPVAFRPYVFQKFTQADSADTRQKGGTGLGLSISKAIIERLGGAIGFETEVGKGTTFYFELPLLGSSSQHPVNADLPSTHGPILVCEDDPDIATLLSLMLKSAGFTTEVAHTAAQAKQWLNQQRFAAMTLDLALPDQDGISLLRDLRQIDSLQNLPIIVVSAYAQQGHQPELGGGSITMVDWLEKPIDQDRLLKAVQQAANHWYARKPRILHVEDDVDILQIVGQVLAEVAELVAATTLQEAQLKLAEMEFDLVILDLQLSDGFGLDLLPFLNYQGYPVPPVVIFSAQEVGADVVEQVSMALVKARTSNDDLLSTIRSLVGGTAS
ncbi:MAG: PAS domain S-box protein [Cyanobacteriota bacterium]|nr:PAS domain S-box protein [Cyanobacteriota bacterium]